MNFNQVQQALEDLQANCPYNDARDMEIWETAISRMRLLLASLAADEDSASSSATDAPTH